MDAYAMLSRPIREYIYEQGWPALTKIQEGAIRYAKQTTANLVLAAPTASGKTEAAFLPAIDAVEKFQTGIRIVYVSPLVALINDQFKRLSALCQTLDIPVFQWHKDVSATRKKRLVKEPRGILLITPESIEAILTIHPEFVSRLFSKVEWVLVDEIHSFIGNDRGYQLRSLLERLQQAMDNEPRYVAMSATLGETDRTFVKSFFFNRRETLVLVDRTQKELEYTLDFVPPTGDYKRDFDRVAQKVYERSRTRSLLVFANSRHTVEDFALRLRKWGVEDRLPIDYFAHYSNLSKALKRSAEVFAKEEGKPFTICCTSTLELGIDIGAVDEVVQYDAPMSVSSLAQRVGRSGRRHTPSRLVLISSEPWLFLQGYAALSLLKRGQLDSVLLVRKPYNVFAHQVLSLVLQRGSIPLDEFRQLNHSMQAWRWVKDDEKTQIFRFLRKQEMIEICGPDVIAGRALETLMEKGSFFFVVRGRRGVWHLRGRRKAGGSRAAAMDEARQPDRGGGKGVGSDAYGREKEAGRRGARPGWPHAQAWHSGRRRFGRHSAGNESDHGTAIRLSGLPGFASSHPKPYDGDVCGRRTGECAAANVSGHEDQPHACTHAFDCQPDGMRT